MDSLSIYIISFLVVLAGYGFSSGWVNRPRIQKKESELAKLPGGLRMIYSLSSLLAEPLGNFNDRFFPQRRAQIQNLLLIASLHIPENIIFAAEGVYALGGGLIAGLVVLCITRNAIVIFLGVLLGGGLSFLYPCNALTRLGESRQTAIMRALPFAIDLIGAAMRAGVDFVAAVRYYVNTERSGSPLVEEFTIVLRSMELGNTRIQAMEEMEKRVQVPAFSAFCEAVVHGMEIGASIVNTLKVQAEQMRRERFNIAERKAARAASSMIFPIALFIMPAMFLIIGAPVIIRVAASGFAKVIHH